MFVSEKIEPPRSSESPTILHAASQTEVGLANSAIVMRLLRRLMDMDLLTRLEAIRILEGAAEDLLANGDDKLIAHQGAARLIRNKLVPMI